MVLGGRDGHPGGHAGEEHAARHLVAARTSARLSSVSSSAPQSVTVREPPTARSTSIVSRAEPVRTTRAADPKTSSCSAASAMKSTACTSARKGRGVAPGAAVPSTSGLTLPWAFHALTPWSKCARMPAESMACGASAWSLSASVCTNASPGASRRTTITPGLVQNWPAPRQIEPASVSASAAPRVCSAAGRATRGFTEPSSL